MESERPKRRVPKGWVPPGPRPPDRDPGLSPDETASYLTGDFRIIQRKDGHRWSLDDLVTAWAAREAGLTTQPKRILDLGTGVGSVSLMLAWSFPEAEVVGVEAQALSQSLARRSVVLNGVEARMTIIHQDLRDYDGAGFDLVTGTPPYFDDPDMPRSDAVQKGPCRFEDRGSIFDYLVTARRAVTPSGTIVVCHASLHRPRVLQSIADNALRIARAIEVVPKVRKDALVDVFVLDIAAGTNATFERLVVRDKQDQWTPEFLALRLAMGMPPKPD